MNRLFGSSKPVARPNIEDSIAANDSKVENIDSKVRKLNEELLRIKTQIAKANKNSPTISSLKQRAIRVLKQKKLLEGQQDLLQGQSFNMLQATITTDNLKNTLTTYNAMKVATKELKQSYKNVDVRKIETMQDEMEDLLDLANEVQDSITRDYGVDINEDELDAELDALGDDFGFEGIEDGSNVVPSYLEDRSSKLPAVPSSQAVDTKDDTYSTSTQAIL